MADAPANLDEALKDAHLPALMAALVHLTGDAELAAAASGRRSTTRCRATTPGIPEEEQAEDPRAGPRRDPAAHLAGTPLPMPRPPTADVLRRMMDFVAGAPIPERYTDFLIDELALARREHQGPAASTRRG